MNIQVVGPTAQKLTPLALMQKSHLAPLMHSASALLALKKHAFSEAALATVALETDLRASILQGNLSPQELELRNLSLVTMRIGRSKTAVVLVDRRDFGRNNIDVFFCGAVYSLDLSGVSNPAACAMAVSQPSQSLAGQRTIIDSKPEALFVDTSDIDKLVPIIADNLEQGILMSMVTLRYNIDFDKNIGEPVAAILKNRGMNGETIQKRLAELKDFLFLPHKDTTQTKEIMEATEKLETLQRESLNGRKIKVYSDCYAFIEQWLLCNPGLALYLSEGQKKILLEASDLSDLQKGSVRSDGGKLMLLLEEMYSLERGKFLEIKDYHTSCAAAFPVLRDNVFSDLCRILDSLEHEATLPNGYLAIYRGAREVLEREVEYLAQAINDSNNTSVEIRGNTIIVKHPWRGDVEWKKVVSRRGIYAFMEGYNRKRAAKDQIHLAISYDAECNMGYEYMVGIDPNSSLEVEIDLTNLWEKLGQEEKKKRATLGFSELRKGWGGFSKAGGSPMFPKELPAEQRKTSLSIDDIVSAIGRMPVIENVRQGVAMYRRHSLNLPEYLIPRIPKAALDLLDEGKFVSIELHHGPLSTSMQYITDKRSQLERLAVERTEDGVKQHWYRVKGTNQFIVVNILGETKLMHMRLYLTYAGLSVEKIYHHVYSEDYMVDAKNLIAATKSKNNGKFPKMVVVGPGGTISYILAERINAARVLAAFLKPGLKGEELLNEVEADLSRAVNMKLEELAANLDYGSFTKNNPKIPAQEMKNVFIKRIKQCLKLLAEFGIILIESYETAQNEEIEQAIPNIQAEIRVLTPKIIGQIFDDKTNLTAAFSLDPEEIMLNPNLAARLLALRDKLEGVYAKLGMNRNPPFILPEKLKPESMKARVPNDVYQASLIRLPGKAPFLMVTIPFGSLSGYLGQAVAEENVENVTFFGNGGFIAGAGQNQTEINVGDLFVPSTMLEEKGEANGFVNDVVSYALAQRQEVVDLAGGTDSKAGDSAIRFVLTTHAGYVDSPLQEHDAFLADLMGRKATSVELEMGPLVRGLGAKPSLSVSMMGYFSDIPGKEGETLADAELGTNPRILRAKEQMGTYLLSQLSRRR
ncbi:hypothetical protein HZC34_07600 [Candidatus Saganbacteria bacterium]|nr:hypothetical protein [Candidatus Saganbacteria bacterium]